MKVELLVSDWCPTCPQAERVWRQVAEERNIEFSVVDMSQPEGRALAQRLRLKTIPATAIDGALVAVGVPSLDEARRMTASAPPKARVAFAGGALMWTSFVIFAARLWPVLWPPRSADATRHA
jgi:thioredoxin-like negative regulator of GroEL